MKIQKFFLSFSIAAAIALFMLGAVLHAQADGTPPAGAHGTLSQSNSPSGTITPQYCYQIPSAPVLYSPANNVELTSTRVVLRWYKAQCAVNYKVLVKKDSLNDLPLFQTTVTTTYITTPPLAMNHVYYWQVKACNSYECKASSWFKFTVTD